jgi:hypothetical protein
MLDRISATLRSLARRADHAAIAEDLEDLGSGDARRRDRALGYLDGLPPEADDRLRSAADDRRLPPEQRVGAIYLLLRRSAELPRHRRYLRTQRVPLPHRVPEAVREAIVRNTGAGGMLGETDIRWFAEAASLGAYHWMWDDDSPVPARVPALRDALRHEGIPTEPAVPYEEVRGRDRIANFLVMRAGDHRLRLSLVGPFLDAEGDAPRPFRERCRRAAAAAGWLYLEPDVLDVPVAGLHVDGYGRRGVLTVGEHLFDAGIPDIGPPLP